MSCDWDVYCRTCKDGHGGLSDANHRTDLVNALIRHADAIAVMSDALQDPELKHEVELRTSYGRIDATWFAQHAGHDLVARSEYGDFYDKCDAYVRCGECATRHKCRLHAGHGGEHSLKET